jgi:peptidoglycan/xylan/chitin deacetylase (PgdA/CDA1 family)
MHDIETELGHSKCRHLMQLEEEMGFRSSFNFVPERYSVSPELRQDLVKRGFEVGVHGLKHDGKLFLSRKKFCQQAIRINQYLKEWRSVGFVSPSMHRNLDWMHELNIEYDASTFDTDPFEPQPDGMGTIFPFLVHGGNGQKRYVELPYTLPQDFTLFVMMKEKNIDIWKKKLDWIVKKGGMALLITHPDYMNGHKTKPTIQEYSIGFYKELLEYVNRKYAGQYWHPLPKEIARFWKEKMADGEGNSVTKSIVRPKVTSIG